MIIKNTKKNSNYKITIIAPPAEFEKKAVAAM